MKFPKVFRRYVGGDGPQLGSDKSPVQEGGKELLDVDNVLVCRQFNTNAWPVQRVIVAWYGPEAKGLPSQSLPIQVFAFDHSTEFWFATGPVRDVPEGVMVTFDMPALADSPTAQPEGPQPIEALVVVGASQTKGEYVFVVGGDVSNTP